MTATIDDTKGALDAAERELRDLLAEEANGPALLRAAGRSGDIAAVRGQQARQFLLPVLIPAARERMLRARLAHHATERATIESEIATRRAELSRLEGVAQAAELAAREARAACYNPAVMEQSARHSLETLGYRRRGTVRELAALLDLEVGDDGELCGKAADDAA